MNEQLLKVANLLAQAKSALDQVDWNAGAIASPEVGRHLTSLESHLDNAQGRLSTLRQEVRWVEARLQRAELEARPVGR